MTPTAAAHLALVQSYQLDRESEKYEHQNIKESRAAALEHAENAASDIMAAGIMSAVGKGISGGAALYGGATGKVGTAGTNDPMARPSKAESLGMLANAGLEVGSTMYNGDKEIQSAKQQEESGNVDLAITAKNNHTDARKSAVDAMKEITQADAQAAQQVLRG